MAHRIGSALILLCVLHHAQVSNASDFGLYCLLELLHRLRIDHVSLRFGVFHSAGLLFALCVSDSQVGAIEVVLRYLCVVVEDGKLVMLPRLQSRLLRL